MESEPVELVSLPVEFWASAIGSSGAEELAESAGFGSLSSSFLLFYDLSFYTESSWEAAEADFDPSSLAAPDAPFLPPAFLSFFFGTISRNFNDLVPALIVAFGNKVMKSDW